MTRGRPRPSRPSKRKSPSQGTREPRPDKHGARNADRAPRTPQPGPRSADRGSRSATRGSRITIAEIRELDALRKKIARAARRAPPMRWNAEPDEVRRSVVQLVLTLVEFIRKLLERQAIRRMDAGTLTAAETERVGRALMQLEETVRDLGAQFGISPDELNLDLGPLGKLM